jgi:hypothetical protein
VFRRLIAHPASQTSALVRYLPTYLPTCKHIHLMQEGTQGRRWCEALCAAGVCQGDSSHSPQATKPYSEVRQIPTRNRTHLMQEVAQELRGLAGPPLFRPTHNFPPLAPDTRVPCGHKGGRCTALHTMTPGRAATQLVSN